MKLTADVEAFLNEENYGWKVYCYEDNECITQFVFNNKVDAMIRAAQWCDGQLSSSHRLYLQDEVS